jgi:hypothetical protein
MSLIAAPLVNSFEIYPSYIEVRDTTQITVSKPTLEITPLKLGRPVSEPIK